MSQWFPSVLYPVTGTDFYRATVCEATKRSQILQLSMESESSRVKPAFRDNSQVWPQDGTNLQNSVWHPNRGNTLTFVMLSWCFNCLNFRFHWTSTACLNEMPLPERDIVQIVAPVRAFYAHIGPQSLQALRLLSCEPTLSFVFSTHYFRLGFKFSFFNNPCSKLYNIYIPLLHHVILKSCFAKQF